MSRSCGGLAVLVAAVLLLQGCSKEETTGPTPRNGAPGVPASPFPASNAAAQPLSLTLHWDACTDPENDPVTYDVYFGTATSPPLVASNLTATSYGPGDLSGATTYLWKIVAKDTRGDSTAGPVWNFRTSAGATPTVTTGSIANVASDSASGGGTVSSQGSTSVTARGVCWNTTQNPTTADSHAENGAGTGSFTSSITGLSPSTTYYVRAYATNSVGTAYGQQETLTTSYGDGGIPCPGTPTVSWGGRTYNTALIGSQCWLKDNLDIGTRIDDSQDQTNNTTIEKYCYGDDPANCATYGGLYQWDEAMQYGTNEGAQGICPPGWHLPTLAEFQTLSSTVGGDGNALKAIGQGTGGGAGTNTSGFSALLAGYREYGGGFGGLGGGGVFWSSTQYDARSTYYMELYYDYPNIGRNNYYNSPGYSIRCLKD